MKKLFILSALLLFPVSSLAQEQNTDAALEQFANDYYAAVTQKDLGKRRSLVLSQSLSCVDAVSSEFFAQALSYPVNENTSDLTWKIADAAMTEPLLVAAKERLPVQPDLVAQIDWKSNFGTETAERPNIIALKKEGERYFEVLPCPAKEDIEKRNAYFSRLKER